MFGAGRLPQMLAKLGAHMVALKYMYQKCICGFTKVVQSAQEMWGLFHMDGP